MRGKHLLRPLLPLLLAPLLAFAAAPAAMADGCPGCCLHAGGCANATKPFCKNQLGGTWHGLKECLNPTSCKPCIRNVPAATDWGLLGLAVLLGGCGMFLARDLRRLQQTPRA